ncbi:MAG: MarR family transcriptional regulator [Meiothermus sp.]
MNHSAPRLDELEALALQVLWQMRQDAQRAYEPLGFSSMQCLALNLIRSGVEQPGALAEVLEASPPGVSQLLNSLEDRGLIRREIEASDRRRIRLTLTAQGEEQLGELNRRWREVTLPRYRQLSEGEIETLIAVYQKMLGVLEEAP